MFDQTMTMRVLGWTMAAVVAAATITGCSGPAPEPQPENRDPVANAGRDTAVAPNDVVQLDGTTSFDPDGDLLAYTWEQIAGIPVTLDAFDSATPTFTAPATATLIVFVLTVDDGMAEASDIVEIDCVDDEPENGAPVADAGADQRIEAGTVVQLDGSGSSDPDGDDLAFAWLQVSGTPVTLDDDTSATPTFTAPLGDDTLAFELLVMDAEGLADTAAVTIHVRAREAVLYLANFEGDSVVRFNNPAALNGNVIPDIHLQGTATLMDEPSDIVVTADHDLVISNHATPSITTYNDAERANGNLAPDGNVTGQGTRLRGPSSIAIDEDQDLLYVADNFRNVIFVYDDASSSSFNGNREPARFIRTRSSGDLREPTGINFGAADELYVANAGRGNVLVFDDVSTLNGDVTPTRIIESPAFTDVFDVYVDRDDVMYVVSGYTAEVWIFENASRLNGRIVPDLILEVVGANALTAVAVDRSGTGFLVDADRNAVYSFDDIASSNGPLLPDRTIRGSNTLLDTPLRLFLAE